MFLAMIATLFFAGWTDLKKRILPNELIVAFLVLACAFHISTFYDTLSYKNIVLGCIIGGGSMLIVRTLAGMFYQKEALGMGDVKLLAAAGALLGPENFFIALALGAFAGLLHGLILAQTRKMQDGHWPALSTLSMPAGPGFIAGIFITGVYAYYPILTKAFM